MDGREEYVPEGKRARNALPGLQLQYISASLSCTPQLQANNHTDRTYANTLGSVTAWQNWKSFDGIIDTSTYTLLDI